MQWVEVLLTVEQPLITRTYERRVDLMFALIAVPVSLLEGCRWATKRANKRHKDHLDGQLSRVDPAGKQFPPFYALFFSRWINQLAVRQFPLLFSTNRSWHDPTVQTLWTVAHDIYTSSLGYWHQHCNVCLPIIIPILRRIHCNIFCHPPHGNKNHQMIAEEVTSKRN